MHFWEVALITRDLTNATKVLKYFKKYNVQDPNRIPFGKFSLSAFLAAALTWPLTSHICENKSLKSSRLVDKPRFVFAWCHRMMVRINTAHSYTVSAPRVLSLYRTLCTFVPQQNRYFSIEFAKSPTPTWRRSNSNNPWTNVLASRINSSRHVQISQQRVAIEHCHVCSSLQTTAVALATTLGA